jgi:hypothetical protein
LCQSNILPASSGSNRKASEKTVILLNDYYLLSSFFDPEDGSSAFTRSICELPNYTSEKAFLFMQVPCCNGTKEVKKKEMKTLQARQREWVGWEGYRDEPTPLQTFRLVLSAMVCLANTLTRSPNQTPFKNSMNTKWKSRWRWGWSEMKSGGQEWERRKRNA